jgi:predicted dehydrogenase
MIDSNQPQPLRWGILGAARIARKAFARAIQATGGGAIAIGASSLERAREFAGEFGIPRAFEGYRPVLESPEVEAVYIPLANGLHFQWALECARAGKHCLCEKPLVLTADEAQQLREAFAQAGCLLVEGFMWRHHPLAAWLEQQLGEGGIGELQRVSASFSFMFDRPDDFRWRDDQGGGALWDIGGYCVNAMRMFFAGEPQLVSARSRWVAPESRTDAATVGWLDFGENRLGTFNCSFTSAYHQFITLVGSRGVIQVDRPFTGLAGPVTAQVQIGDAATQELFEPDNAYERLVEHFTRAARDPSFALSPAEDGLAQSRVMEALARSALNSGAPEMLAGY